MTPTSLAKENTERVGASRIIRLWRRLPILLRAIVAGLFVFIVLQTGNTMIFLANMSTTPEIPWMLPAGLAYLWVAFQFFNGRWGPKSTAIARRGSMRARRLGRGEWAAALGAAFPVMLFFITVTMISYRLVTVPSEELPMPELPWWSTYSALLMISVVAGVSEEAGFRGYMQAPLEKRYGPLVAIIVASAFFWVAHLNHANGVPRVGALFIMGASLGLLAWCARSILPAIIAHAAADTIVFMGSVSSLGPNYIWEPVPLKESGVDGFFWIVIVLVVLSGITSAVMLRRLAKITHSEIKS
ncbi:MAG: CPBP family intramembrane metalloprotease [bacterium]|nr:CPBP family intramembrane metalloprotease [bacterium]